MASLSNIAQPHAFIDPLFTIGASVGMIFTAAWNFPASCICIYRSIYLPVYTSIIRLRLCTATSQRFLISLVYRDSFPQARWRKTTPICTTSSRRSWYSSAGQGKPSKCLKSNLQVANVAGHFYFTDVAGAFLGHLGHSNSRTDDFLVISHGR